MIFCLSFFNSLIVRAGQVTAIALALGCLALSASAQHLGELELDITGGTKRQIPIGISDFVGTDHEAMQLGQQISEVIRGNLDRAGLLKTLRLEDHPQDADQTFSAPDHSQWQQAGSFNLVTGRVEASQYGRMTIEYFLYDTVNRRQLTAHSLETMTNNWRRVGHVISDSVMKRITGEDGAFDTKIVYVSETGPKTNRTKQLAIMDQDGGNHQILTSAEIFVTSPRFSPLSQEITYVALVNNQWRVYIYNLQTGQQEIIADFDGTPAAPRFSPKGDRMLVSISQQGNTDIFEVDLTTRKRTRLTNGLAIDTSASYAPNGRRIVFESDRGGSQQIYVMDLGSDVARRISRGDGQYSTPVWSPTGEWIAFTKQKGGKFHIGIMRPDGSEERLVANGFVAESPTWAPNGRSLAYYKQAPTEFGDTMQTALYSVDLYSFTERFVQTPHDASDPAWSPRIR